MTQICFRTAALSLPGGLPVNQDSWADASDGYGNHCWTLADGLGGHGGGEVASRLAVDAVIAAFRANPRIDAETLRQYCLAASAAIRDGQNTDQTVANMRTTLVVLVSNGELATCAHIGDSRLYMFRDGRIVYQTRDHSVPQAMADAGQLPHSAIRTNEDRGSLLRSLGGDSEPRFDYLTEPLRVEIGDAYLICSDGLWDYVIEAEMEADLAKSRSPQEWLERMFADRVLIRAPKESDNMTAVAVQVDGA